MLNVLFVFACSQLSSKPETNVLGDTGTDEDLIEIVEPLSVRMWRLTDVQYRNAVFDILDVDYTAQLPVDYDLHGYVSVGAADVSIAPYDLELYESAAWEIATSLIPDASARVAHMGCDVAPSPVQQIEGVLDVNDACVEAWVLPLFSELWRRPIRDEELDDLLDLFVTLSSETSATTATQAVIATGLLAPDFLYRIETGTAEPDDGVFALSDYELAARLSFFLTDSTPDEELRLAAADGALRELDNLEYHTRRLLDEERAELALVRFFSETLDLERIYDLEKNETLYPQDSPELREAMVVELEQLFLSVALDGDFRNLLTSELAYLSPELASFYGLSDVAESGWYFLPEDQNRGGLLGRSGFLALNATPVRSSPTHRGKFIRTRLLCQDIPPPPEGVVASLEGIDPNSTLREQLEQHMADPACNSCHAMMDPLGFPLEHFNAMGEYRETDNGYPVDASGMLDGFSVEGAAELGEAVSEHERFSYCVSAQLMRHAVGTLEGSRQEQYVLDLQSNFMASGFHFKELVVSLVQSTIFRGTSGLYDGNSCTIAGDVRACQTDCGEGVETCIDGLWQSCTAAPVSAELCDDIDQDCDGEVDNLVQSCLVDGVPGVQSCTFGEWSACEQVVSAEICDGIDNDYDGDVDNDLTLEIVTASIAELQAQHGACDPMTTGVSGPCNAAVNRLCASRGCGTVSGFGLLAMDIERQLVSVACLSSSEMVLTGVSFDDLAGYHSYCLESEPVSPDCNASINRFCADQGLTTGFGPLEHSNGMAYVGCTPTAEKFGISYDELTAFQPECYWPLNRHTDACNTAIHQWCHAEGYASGYGPLENSDNIAYVACIPWPEATQ